MKSIRTKLLQAAFLVIASLSCASAGFFIMHLVVVENYKAISDTMIAQYRLIDATGSLIDTYNTRFRNLDTEDTKSTEAITSLQNEIKELERYLDTRNMNTKIQTNYVGLKNTINDVVKEINTGLAALSSGTVSDASTYYDQANLKYGFVKDNGTQLVFSELQYANSVQDEITTLYRVSAIAGVIVLFLIILFCILYFVSFANRLVEPIQKLTKIAEQIAEGNMNVPMSDDLLKQNDEIGSLSNSYHIMITKLLENITKLDGSNKQLTDASSKLSSNNEELERMNKFMVGREIKMQELKSLVSQLVGKLKEHGITDYPQEALNESTTEQKTT
jgi:nitrogen fixation/metabolism regulation signal transduction histidine kinase